MYFPDLTPYEYYVKESDQPAINVGWLSKEHNFIKGTPPSGFVDRLRSLLRFPVNQMRGFQVCEFCTNLNSFLECRVSTDEEKALYHACFADGRFSSAEIRVVGRDGTVYASPRALVHYVEAHGYLPPQEFIEAVMQTVSIGSEREV